MPGLLGAIPTILQMVGNLFGKDMESDTTKVQLATLEAQLQGLAIQQGTEQVKVNEQEAAAPNRTWLTWRELVGYTCAMAFAYHFLFQQILSFIFNALGHPVVLPTLEISELMTVLMGMLGLGGLQGAEHYINSVYNSPQGSPPQNESSRKGHIGPDGVWVDS